LSGEAGRPLRVAILTVSDSVSAGRTEDKSGKSLAARCQELKWNVVASATVADDAVAIQTFLKEISDANRADVILTTGGTGLGPRDITPEATVAVMDRLIPGFPEMMRSAGSAITQRAWLSRSAAGIRGETIVINLPGSPGGARESLDVVADLLPHAVAVLHGARHD
jgi:molybdopterin adenylyltransferase